MSEQIAAVINVGIKWIKLTTANSYLQMVNKIIAAQPVVTALVDITELTALVEKLHVAMVAKSGYNQTERLVMADKFRDAILSAINYNLKGEVMMPTENQDDAKALLRVFKEFGLRNMQKAKYSDETELIRSLITRLNSGDNLARLAKFPKLSDWTTTLEEANNEFETIMNEKADEVELDYTSATSIRNEIAPVYDAVIGKINAHALIGTAPEFATTVEAINAHIIANQIN